MQCHGDSEDEWVLVEREEARACQDEAGAAGGSYAPTRRRGRGGVGGLIQRFLGPHPQDQGQPRGEGAGPRAPGGGGRRALWVWVDDFGYEVPYAAVEQQAIEHGWLTGKDSVRVARGREVYTISFAGDGGVGLQENRRTRRTREIRRITREPQSPAGLLGAAINAKDNLVRTARTVQELDVDTATAIMVEATAGACRSATQLAHRMLPTREQVAQTTLVVTRQAVTLLYAASRFVALRMRRSRRAQLLRLLDPTSNDFRGVEQAFARSLPHMQIHSIHEIRHSAQRSVFLAHKLRMDTAEQRACPRPRGSNERVLFHGSDQSSAERVLCRMFRPSYGAQRGHAPLGRGTYFSTEASGALGHCRRNADGHFVMVLASVLLGNCCEGGSPDLREAPIMSRGPDGEDLALPVRYDTVVDNTGSPALFALFGDLGRAYPRYVITFSESC